MVKKIVSIVCFMLVISVGYAQADNKIGVNDHLPGLKIGEQAPNFKLENLDGKSVQLSDFHGKKVILNFWATWCPPCKKEMPEMEAFYQEAGKDVVILAVNIDPQYNVKKFVQDTGITFPVLLDKTDQVNEMYQVIAIPTTYFIDEKGIIRNKHLSAITKEMMLKYIDDF